MKKNRKNSPPCRILLYAVFVVFCWGVSSVLASPQDPVRAAVNALESSIYALIDPFIVKINETPVVAPVTALPVESAPPIVTPVEVPPAPKVEPVDIVVPPPIQAPEVNLTGIIFNPEHSMVIVDGQIIEEGQMIVTAAGKMVVTKINKMNIEILYMGVPFTIAMDQEE